jgi:hypothetical protein
LESWELSQHSLLDTAKPRKTCAEVAGRRTFRTSNETGNMRINVTSRRSPLTAVGVEKQCVLHILSVCVCGLSRAHVPFYIVICSQYGCTIFPLHYLINGTIAGEKFIEHKM